MQKEIETVRRVKSEGAPPPRAGRRFLCCRLVIALGFSALFVFAGAREAPAICADDAVAVGSLCVDKYEATVWSLPPGGGERGTVYGVDADDYPCADDGHDCDAIFAASLPGEIPSTYLTWFQAQQACANAGKRLLTNAEWQRAVWGTPDRDADNGTSDCNTFGDGAKTRTGTRGDCRSTYGSYDMVGNVWEWVADWAPRSTACTGWGDLSHDQMCFAGTSTAAGGPAALLRGGYITAGAGAGPLAVSGFVSPSDRFDNLGFRCVR